VEQEVWLIIEVANVGEEKEKQSTKHLKMIQPRAQ
jgi:hypothetical protein